MRAVLVLLVLGLLVAAGCGGSGGDDSSPQGSASSAPCPRGATVIHMHDIAFKPDRASVKAGKPVCWVNDDDVQHDVQADGGQFKSPLYGQGQTYTAKVAEPGSVSYVCTVHPNMTATLRVTP